MLQCCKRITYFPPFLRHFSLDKNDFILTFINQNSISPLRSSLSLSSFFTHKMFVSILLLDFKYFCHLSCYSMSLLKIYKTKIYDWEQVMVTTKKKEMDENRWKETRFLSLSFKCTNLTTLFFVQGKFPLQSVLCARTIHKPFFNYEKMRLKLYPSPTNNPRSSS